MKNVIIAIVIAAATTLTGCAVNHVDGSCATNVEGTCVAEWQNNQIVGVGSVDMKFNGLKKVNGEISGDVTTKVKRIK